MLLAALAFLVIAAFGTSTVKALQSQIDRAILSTQAPEHEPVAELDARNSTAPPQSQAKAPDSAPSGHGVDLAKKLANPISSLISVPIQVSYDDSIGLNDNGSVWRINVQPVIPVNGAGESGFGDILQSFFFSPKQPTSSGVIWGVGPAVLLNTASHDALGSKKWGAGPTGVALKQVGPWTYGMLANHIESFSSANNRPGVSATFVQPFLAYITQSKTTFSLNTESTYDWKNEDWAVPVNFSVSQLLKAGNQMLQVQGGLRYWADSSDFGPEGLGARIQLTFLFPK